MRTCIIIAVLFLANSTPPVTKGHQTDSSHPNRKDDQRAGNQNSKAPIIPIAFQERRNSPSQPSSQPQEEVEKNSSDQERMWPPSSGWAIVYITGIYALISGLTLCAIWRQVSNVARLERPWILISVGRPAAVGVANGGRDVSAPLCIGNYGRSPAWITQCSACIRCFDRAHLPPKPDYRVARLLALPSLTFSPGREHSVTVQEPVSVADWNGVAKNPRSTIFAIYGEVRYRDIFRKARRTSFWFFYNPSYQNNPVTTNDCPNYVEHT